MLAPNSPYVAPPLVQIMESFKAMVEAIDENSPSNLSTTTSSPPLESYRLSQLAA